MSLVGVATAGGTTDAKGPFQFTGLPAGAYLLELQAVSTREGALTSAVTVPDGGVAQAGRFTFHPVGGVSGTVTAADGAPASGGTVVAVVGTGAVAHPDAAGPSPSTACPSAPRPWSPPPPTAPGPRPMASP